MNAPETIVCQCGSTAHYAGTQDAIRVYVCTNKHVTQVRPDIAQPASSIGTVSIGTVLIRPITEVKS